MSSVAQRDSTVATWKVVPIVTNKQELRIMQKIWILMSLVHCVSLFVRCHVREYNSCADYCYVYSIQFCLSYHIAAKHLLQ